MPLFWISLSYFKPFTSNVFLRNNEAYKLYYTLKEDNLSTIYVKFVLLAYSVFLQNEWKRTYPNKWRMKISKNRIRKAYRDDVIVISHFRLALTTVARVISQTIDPRRDTSRIVRSAFIILRNGTESLVAYSYYSTESNGTCNARSREFVF